jgi:hypothetical protein
MTEPSLATSADYADALIVARTAKKWIFLILMLMLLLQIGVFFVARYTTIIPIESPRPASTLPALAATTRPAGGLLLSYVTAAATFFGTVLPILLALVLLLIVNVMLVGRLIGLSRVTSAFIWCLLLALLLFPWQAFFGGTTEPSDFRLPGLIYTWDELVHHAKFEAEGNVPRAMLKWARFLVFPVLALILLMIVQIKSNRGLRQALGEAAPDNIS